MSEKTYRCAACYTPGWPNLNPGCISLMTTPEPDGVHKILYCVRSHEMIDFKPDGTQDRFPVDLVLSAGNLTHSAERVAEMLKPVWGWGHVRMPAFESPEKPLMHLLSRRWDGDATEYTYSPLRDKILIRRGPHSDDFVARTPSDVFEMMRAREAGTEQWGFWTNAARLILVRKLVIGAEGAPRFQRYEEDGRYLGAHVSRKGQRVDLYARDFPRPQLFVRYGDKRANYAVADYYAGDRPDESSSSLGAWPEYEYALIEAWRRTRADDSRNLGTLEPIEGEPSRGPLLPVGAPSSPRTGGKKEAQGIGSFFKDNVAQETRVDTVSPVNAVTPDGQRATVYLKVKGASRFPTFDVPLEFTRDGSTMDLIVAKGWRFLAVGQDFNAQLTRFFLRLNPTKEDLATVGGGDLAELCLSTHTNKLAVAAAVCRLYLHREGDYAFLVDPRTVLRVRHGESFPGLNEVHDHPAHSLDLAAELKRGTSRWHIIHRQPPSESQG